MNKRLFLGTICMSLALASHAAPDTPAPGQKLTQQQIAQWGDLPVYKVGKSKFRVLPVHLSDAQLTLVINGQGVVGVSRNELAISKVPADIIQHQLRQTVPQPLSVEYFEQAGVTVARYADFGQAVEAMRAVQTVLPEAQVRLPVQFDQTAY